MPTLHICRRWYRWMYAVVKVTCVKTKGVNFIFSDEK